MAKHALRELKMGRVLCSCGFNWTDPDIDFPMFKRQDRLLDKYLEHRKQMDAKE